VATHTRVSESVGAYFAELKTLLDAVPLERIDEIGDALYSAYRHDKQVFVVGNGGSASTASHMACDLAKNTLSGNRPRFRVMSLTDNVALMSALANDIGYEHVFKEQLVNLVRTGDVLIVLSGSGNSANVLEAMRYARERSATVIAFLGFDGGAAVALADHVIVAPTEDYGLIEDVHLILNHALTSYFRSRLEHEPVQQ
jgi:D-sedoheptulose 7-phosphate isomerase